MHNPWLLAAAISGLVAVVAGAYGWHGLQADDGARAVFNTGVQYQMWHTLALLAVAWLADSRPRDTAASKWARRAGVCFVAGILVFSGSMYFYGLFGDVPLSWLAPAGGIALMAGWVCLGVAAIRNA
ncbi:MAG: DUF423 domain-containing protein [Rhodospirillales bacterium]|nr:DUF423 domain-containing protein [Rhodospirillales bacterium]